MINVVVKNAGERPEEQSIENNIESMQAIVGGYIEVVKVRSDILLVINEEGKMRGLAENFAMMTFEINQENKTYSSQLHDIICGNGFFVSAKGEEFESLNEEQVHFINSTFNLDGTLFISDRTEGVHNG